jgi:hypothetical protein
MSMSTAPPGWHPDPAAPQAQLRWWDGTRWTEHVQPRAQQAPAPVAAAGWSGGHGWQQSRGWGHSTPAPNFGFTQQNKFSLITGGIVAVYVFLALTTGIVFIGILPILMSVRALRRKEPLGPLAVGAAILAVIIALAALAGR